MNAQGANSLDTSGGGTRALQDPLGKGKQNWNVTSCTDGWYAQRENISLPAETHSSARSYQADWVKLHLEGLTSPMLLTAPFFIFPIPGSRVEKDLSKGKAEWICSPRPGAPESHCCGQGRTCDGSRDQDSAEGIEGKQMLRACSILAV